MQSKTTIDPNKDYKCDMEYLGVTINSEGVSALVVATPGLAS